MSTSTRMPVRTTVLQTGFVLYAILSLISMATMSIGAVILILAILLTSKSASSFLNELETTSRIPVVRTYLILSIFLMLACMISLYWGELHPLKFGGRGPTIHFLSDMAKVWYLFWPWLLLVGLKRLNSKARLLILKSWLLTFVVLSLIGVGQYFTGWPRPQSIPGNPGRYHVTIFLGHHLSVASLLIFPFFALLEYGFYPLGARLRLIPSRSSIFFVAFTGFLALMLTYSRTLWIALPVSLLSWITWTTRTKKRTVIAACAMSFLAVSQIPAVQKRLHDAMGIGERRELWVANLKFFSERPITGVGWRYNQELSGYYLMDKHHTTEVFSGHAHNNILDMMGGTGALGTLAWLAWCYWVIRILFKSKLPSSQPEFSRGIACAWIAFHLNGLTQVNFWEAKIQHQIAWVVAWSLLWPQETSKEKPKERA